jgi:UDP-N-acetylmuramoyl-L-alanyl-D-glutamate--2,6-diaminopimelate ligase
MGRAAARGADIVWVTSDNPRREDPEAIARAIHHGIPPGTRVHTELDRARAIECAIASAEEGDLVLIAGKGHEDVQEIEDRRIPFDDREVARQAIAERRGAGGGSVRVR